HRCRGQLTSSPNDHMVTIDAGVCTKTDEFVDKAEAGFEDVLRDDAHPLRCYAQRDRHRLQVSREAREWQRLIVHRSGLGLLHHAEARRVGFHVRAGELELFQRKVQVLRVNAADGHIPLGDRRSISPRARDDAVTDYLVFHRMQLLHAGDGMTFEPPPSTLAPISLSMSHRSTISGSRAALSRTVTPSARTAAVRMFSVAPTEGKSSLISAPC